MSIFMRSLASALDVALELREAALADCTDDLWAGRPVGIFSFGAGDEGLSVDLNEALTVIVGPNASGKTNLIRTLDVVRTVVRFQDPKQENRGALAERLECFVSVARHGTASVPEAAQVRVRVAFTRPDEQAMLAAFIQAVLFAALLDGQVPNDRTIRTTGSAWPKRGERGRVVAHPWAPNES